MRHLRLWDEYFLRHFNFDREIHDEELLLFDLVPFYFYYLFLFLFFIFIFIFIFIFMFFNLKPY